MFNRADLTVGGGKKLSGLPHRQVSNQKKYDRKRYIWIVKKASSKITFV